MAALRRAGRGEGGLADRGRERAGQEQGRGQDGGPRECGTEKQWPSESWNDGQG